MPDRWTDRLSEYLDGELAGAERRELETHLASCSECRAVLDDLRAVVRKAGALADRPPAGDLWPGIAERIGVGRTRVVDLDAARRARAPRRLQVAWPQLVAAAVALMAMSAGGAWFVIQRAGEARGAAVMESGGAGVVPAASFAGPSYDRAVRDLWATLAEGRGRLDTATVRVIEQSLRKIDTAIADARRALAADPASEYLNHYLAQTMRRKLDLLRRAAALASAES
jgi:anti-sigma factor RsiW